MARRFQRKLSTTTKNKMSAAKKGSKNPMYAKRHTEATKEKISKKMIEYWKQIPKLTFGNKI